MDRILIGVVIGGSITFFISYILQNRQFNFDRRKQKEIYKSLLETLIQEIKYVDKKLKENGSIVSEYYDVRIQDEVIIKLLDTELFFKNRKVFDDIRRLIHRLLILNKKIENYILIVRQDNRYWDKEVDARRAESQNEVNDYKNEIVHDINFQDIIEKLENIKNSIK